MAQAYGTPGATNLDPHPLYNVWVPFPHERAGYWQLFVAASGGGNVGGVPAVTGAQGASFLMRSGLPSAVLKQVWDLSDVYRRGYLTFGDFGIAMRFVSLAQAGHLPLSTALFQQAASAQLPVPNFSAATTPAPAAAKASMAMGTAMSGAHVSSPLAAGLHHASGAGHQAYAPHQPHQPHQQPPPAPAHRPAHAVSVASLGLHAAPVPTAAATPAAATPRDADDEFGEFTAAAPAPAPAPALAASLDDAFAMMGPSAPTRELPPLNPHQLMDASTHGGSGRGGAAAPVPAAAPAGVLAAPADDVEFGDFGGSSPAPIPAAAPSTAAPPRGETDAEDAFGEFSDFGGAPAAVPVQPVSAAATTPGDNVLATLPAAEPPQPQATAPAGPPTAPSTGAAVAPPASEPPPPSYTSVVSAGAPPSYDSVATPVRSSPEGDLMSSMLASSVSMFAAHPVKEAPVALDKLHAAAVSAQGEGGAGAAAAPAAVWRAHTAADDDEDPFAELSVPAPAPPEPAPATAPSSSPTDWDEPDDDDWGGFSGGEGEQGNGETAGGAEAAAAAPASDDEWGGFAAAPAAPAAATTPVPSPSAPTADAGGDGGVTTSDGAGGAADDPFAALAAPVVDAPVPGLDAPVPVPDAATGSTSPAGAGGDEWGEFEAGDGGGATPAAAAATAADRGVLGDVEPSNDADAAATLPPAVASGAPATASTAAADATVWGDFEAEAASGDGEATAQQDDDWGGFEDAPAQPATAASTAVPDAAQPAEPVNVDVGGATEAAMGGQRSAAVAPVDDAQAAAAATRVSAPQDDDPFASLPLPAVADAPLPSLVVGAQDPDKDGGVDGPIRAAEAAPAAARSDDEWGAFDTAAPAAAAAPTVASHDGGAGGQDAALASEAGPAATRAADDDGHDAGDEWGGFDDEGASSTLGGARAGDDGAVAARAPPATGAPTGEAGGAVVSGEGSSSGAGSVAFPSDVGSAAAGDDSWGGFAAATADDGGVSAAAGTPDHSSDEAAGGEAGTVVSVASDGASASMARHSSAAVDAATAVNEPTPVTAPALGGDAVTGSATVPDARAATPPLPPPQVEVEQDPFAGLGGDVEPSVVLPSLGVPPGGAGGGASAGDAASAPEAAGSASEESGAEDSTGVDVAVTVQSLVKRERFAEAQALARKEQVLSAIAAATRRKAAAIEDDRLEEAIEARDEIRKLQAELAALPSPGTGVGASGGTTPVTRRMPRVARVFKRLNQLPPPTGPAAVAGLAAVLGLPPAATKAQCTAGLQAIAARDLGAAVDAQARLHWLYSVCTRLRPGAVFEQHPAHWGAVLAAAAKELSAAVAALDDARAADPGQADALATQLAAHAQYQDHLHALLCMHDVARRAAGAAEAVGVLTPVGRESWVQCQDHVKRLLQLVPVPHDTQAATNPVHDTTPAPPAACSMDEHTTAARGGPCFLCLHPARRARDDGPTGSSTQQGVGGALADLVQVGGGSKQSADGWRAQLEHRRAIAQRSAWFGGRSYHVGCINLWLHRVSPQPVPVPVPSAGGSR